MQKSIVPKVRKLPLPLEIRLSSEASITDGLFSLTSKDASSIRIIDIDVNDKYATIEIYPPNKEKAQDRRLTDIFVSDSLIGTELSKSRGLGKDLGQYKYYKRTDGSFYAVIEGTKGRTRKLQLGNPLERNSPINIIARAIKQNFNSSEFPKTKLMQVIPKQLSYGQILKAALDVMNLEGYVEKKQIAPTGGRLREIFKASERLAGLIVTPEQA
jgi:hypothetical protein